MRFRPKDASCALFGLLYSGLPLHGQSIHEDNKSAALFGQVTQSGVPVASATVKAYEEVNNGSYIYLDGKCSSQTNNAGQYSAADFRRAGIFFPYRGRISQRILLLRPRSPFIIRPPIWPMPS